VTTKYKKNQRQK